MLHAVGRAHRLAALAHERDPDVARLAARLADRVSAGAFHVAVVGEFKRGKSTLVNALVGEAVLPTGALPVTAVVTEIGAGERGATVDRLDGSSVEIGLADVASFVTEQGNPDNRRQVRRVRVRLPVPLLESGLVLVDTPGIGSVHRHSTAAAEAAYEESDAAIVVLAADMPLSEAEQELLAWYGGRDARTFIVLNKADHLAPADLDEVTRFVTARVPGLPVWCVSARDAVSGGDGRQFGVFQQELARFGREDLQRARGDAVTAELGRLAGRFAEAVAVEEAAAALDAATLAERVAAFERAARTEAEAFEGDRLLLERDTAGLARRVGDELTAFARRAAERRLPMVVATSGGTVAELHDRLRATVEAAVRSEFDSYRPVLMREVELEWARLADRFRASTSERLQAVRRAAEDVFAVRLSRVEVPQVGDEPDAFWFLFEPTVSASEPFVRLGQRLVPSRVARRRLTARAADELARELDKHAGRARYDLVRRLDVARVRFEEAMSAALDATVGQIRAAAGRAADLGIDRDEARQRLAALRAEVLALAEADDGATVAAWLALCRRLAEGPLDGLDRAADELVAASGGDRHVLEQARRRLLIDVEADPRDPVLVQMQSLWRRALERGDWDWEDKA